MTTTSGKTTLRASGGDEDGLAAEDPTIGLPRQYGPVGPVDPPSPGPEPSPRPPTPPAPPAAPVETRTGRWGQWLYYLLLGPMALADAIGFWLTLSRIIKQNANLVLVFVLALSLAAVAAPGQVGRLARWRREGRGGSLAWMAALTALWLQLGLTMAWLRWKTPLSVTGTAKATGELAPSASVGGTSSSDDALHVALLLLGLFLMTGALAITHGYRYSDPRTPEIRAAIKEKTRLEQELKERRRSVEDAQGALDTVRDDRLRWEKARTRAHTIDEAQIDQLRAHARNEIARHVGDPSGTDELHQDWKDSRSRRRPPDDDNPAELP